MICSGLVHTMGKMHGFLKNCSTDDISLWWPLTDVVDVSEKTCRTHGQELARLSSDESLAHMAESDLKIWGFDFQRGFLTSSRAGSRNQCCGGRVWRRQCGSPCSPHCCFDYATFPSAHKAWVTRTRELFFLLATFYCCYPSRPSISNWMWVLLYVWWIPCVHLLKAIWQQLRQEKLQK